MIEGQLNIDVVRENSRVKEVEITSSRPLHAPQVLIGKTPEQALTIVPMLFNICGVAHSYNARQVLNLNNQTDDNLNKLLVLAETLKEHLLRIFLDMPKLMPIKKTETDIPFIGKIVTNLKLLVLSKDNNQQSIYRFINEIEEYLQKYVFEIPIKQWLKITNSRALLNWSQQSKTIVTQYVDGIFSNHWQKQGQYKVNALPELKSNEVLERLNDKNAKNFIACPTWNNQSHETTPLTRQLDNPLIQDVLEHYKGGLLSRWLARIVEMAVIPNQMRVLLEKPSGGIQQNITSVAQIEAARGRLIHRAEVQNNIIQNYQIVAPTEWNFHPNGLIAGSLQNINIETTDEYIKIAHLMINSIDPCVGYQLSVH